MPKRRHDDPIFQDPRHATQDTIDREVESAEGPASVPRRTSQAPGPSFELEREDSEEEGAPESDDGALGGGIENPFGNKPPSY